MVAATNKETVDKAKSTFVKALFLYVPGFLNTRVNEIRDKTKKTKTNPNNTPPKPKKVIPKTKEKPDENNVPTQIPKINDTINRAIATQVNDSVFFGASFI